MISIYNVSVCTSLDTESLFDIFVYKQLKARFEAKGIFPRPFSFQLVLKVEFSRLAQVFYYPNSVNFIVISPLFFFYCKMTWFAKHKLYLGEKSDKNDYSVRNYKVLDNMADPEKRPIVVDADTDDIFTEEQVNLAVFTLKKNIFFHKNFHRQNTVRINHGGISI